ncbi:MAG: Kelch repeat-containing protein [Planctomycetota bacterium]
MFNRILPSVLAAAVLVTTNLFSAAANGQGLPFIDVPSAVAGGNGIIRMKGLPNQMYVLWFSTVEELTQIDNDIVLFIDPVRALENGLLLSGQFDETGNASFTFPVGAEWEGGKISFQLVSFDNNGFGISNLARATFQKPNTFANAVGIPGLPSVMGDLFTTANGGILAVGGAGPIPESYTPWTQDTFPAGFNQPSYPLSTRIQLADGKILVMGGISATVTGGGGTPGIEVTMSNEAYLFIPNTGDFVATNGPMNLARAGAAGVRLTNGKVFIFGGLGSINLAEPLSLLTGILNSSEIYDPATGMFTLGPSLVEGKALHTATLLNNGQVLVAGGLALALGIPLISNSGYTYNPLTNSFGPLPKFFTGPRMLHSATKLSDGNVILAGGISADLSGVLQSGNLSEIVFGTVNTTTRWNPAAQFGTGGFAAGPNLLESRALHAAAPVANATKVLVAGGISGNLDIAALLSGNLGTVKLPNMISSSEIISHSPNASVAGPNLVTPRAGATGITIPMDGRILIFGGAPGSELYQP